MSILVTLVVWVVLMIVFTLGYIRVKTYWKKEEADWDAFMKATDSVISSIREGNINPSAKLTMDKVRKAFGEFDIELNDKNDCFIVTVFDSRHARDFILDKTLFN